MAVRPLRWSRFHKSEITFSKWCIHCKPVTFGPKWKWIWSPVCELFKQRNKIYLKISFLFDNFNLHTFCKFAMGSSWSGRRAVQPWKYLLNFQFHIMMFVSFLLFSVFNFIIWCLFRFCCFQSLISCLQNLALTFSSRSWCLENGKLIYRSWTLEYMKDLFAFKGYLLRDLLKDLFADDELWKSYLNHLSQPEIAWQLVGLTFCE